MSDRIAGCDRLTPPTRRILPDRERRWTPDVASSEEFPLSDVRTPSVPLKSAVLAVAAAIAASLAVAPSARAQAPDPVVPVPAEQPVMAAAPGVLDGDGSDVPTLEAAPAPPLPEQSADGVDTVGALVETDEGLEVVTVPATPDEVEEVAADLEQEPDVVEVVDVFVDEPATIAARSNDTYRGDLWNLDELGVDSLPDGTEDGSGQIVAVLDTGVRASHPDLRGRVRCDLGADFSLTSRRSVGNACTDPHGHGTHVAGIVSAVGDNGTGVAGVSAAQIMPVRVLDANGLGLASRINAGIIWAVEHGASVINLSLISDETNAYDGAIQYALSENVVVVAAAGNNRSLGNLPQSPGSTTGVFSVAATDNLGLSAPYSYSGPTVMISAPGDYIRSTTPYGYEFSSGTSMAAPHVAGIVARYRAIHEDHDVATIRAAIESTAIDLEEPGPDPKTGHGLIDMHELLTTIDAPADPTRGAVPGTVGFTEVIPADGQVTVEWQTGWAGASPITGYRFHLYRILGGEYVPVVQNAAASADETSATVVGLHNGATYVFVVRADNAEGPGQWSMPSVAVKPRTVPSAPLIGKPNVGPRAVRVRWSAWENGGSPITSYEVHVFQGSTFVRSVRVPGVSGDVPNTPHDVRIGGLTNGRGYTFVVRAVNVAGTGGFSARSVLAVPRTRPGAPRVGKPAPANNAARVYWAAPADNGGAYISRYVVKVYQGRRGIKSVTVSGSKRSVLITGLRNRSYYTFTVTAKNSSGWGRATPRSPTVRTR